MGGLIDPANGGNAVTPSDAVDLTKNSTAIWVGTSGDIKVTMINGDVVTFPNVQDGTLLPIQVRRVWSTGTDASDIVAVY